MVYVIIEVNKSKKPAEGRPQKSGDKGKSPKEGSLLANSHFLTSVGVRRLFSLKVFNCLDEAKSQHTGLSVLLQVNQLIASFKTLYKTPTLMFGQTSACLGPAKLTQRINYYRLSIISSTLVC